MKSVKHMPVIAFVVIAFTLAGCEKEGPAEQAGKEIDQKVETLQDKAEAAGDTAKDKLEDAGDKIEDATDQATK